MEDRWDDEATVAPATPDLAELPLEEALSPGPSISAHPAAARLLARYVHPRSTRSTGGEGGASGGFSEISSPATRKPTFVPTSTPLPTPTTTEHTNRYTFPSPAETRLLATGDEDRALIVRLRAQQRGARALALGELLRLAEVVAPDRPDEKPMAPEARAILQQAEQADPVAVSTVLLAGPE